MSETAPEIIFQKMRAQSPLVQCITNYVAMNIAANVLLAAGASPAMIHAEEESGEFASIVSALTINIGTLSPSGVAGMKAAALAANSVKTPWVYDPVAHFATSYRAKAAREILDLGPTILRGNASEILAFSGATSGGKGADAGDSVEAAEETARLLATDHSMVVAVTGEIDFVTDGIRIGRITGGSPLMPKVTALGCSLTCLIGAFAGAHREDPFDATLAALALYAVAGKRAHKKADGPGSFSVHFLDQLAAITPADLKAEAEINVL